MKTEYNANELLSSQYESLAETKAKWQNVLGQTSNRNKPAAKRFNVVEFLCGLFN